MLDGLRRRLTTAQTSSSPPTRWSIVVRSVSVLKQASRVSGFRGGLAFTLERHDGDGFIMGEGRRYAHSASYVLASIEAAGLVVLQFEAHSARCEAGVPVPGLVIVCGEAAICSLARAVKIPGAAPLRVIGVDLAYPPYSSARR